MNQFNFIERRCKERSSEVSKILVQNRMNSYGKPNSLSKRFLADFSGFLRIFKIGIFFSGDHFHHEGFREFLPKKKKKKKVTKSKPSFMITVFLSTIK